MTSGEGEWQGHTARTASTVEHLQDALAGLNAKEARLYSQLREQQSQAPQIDRLLSRLDVFRAQLTPQVLAARSLNNSLISPTAATASRISTAVKSLDEEQRRVRSVLDVVEQVIELKTCVLGITGSMGAPQDWETAASYLSRARKIPREIVESQFAEETVPTVEVPDSPSVTLENAAESLCGVFSRGFEKAAEQNDGESLSLYFKLFPLIGREDTGLGLFAKHVCAGVARRARENLGAERVGWVFAGCMSRLLEHAAGIVDQNAPLVERHYGKGMMGKVVERLQIELDVQGGIVIDTFTDERALDRKISEVKSYAFPFLVQSFAQAKGLGTPRSGSPALSGSRSNEGPAEDVIDVKEVDALLTEMGIMLSRYSLYCRFLATRERDWHAKEDEEVDQIPLAYPAVLKSSAFDQKLRDRIATPFGTLTTFFFRRSVEKAFQLDEPPSEVGDISGQPYITSAVDDVMYIVNKLLNRTLHTSQKELAIAAISSISRVLSSDFIGMIQRKMRDECYPKQNNGSTNFLDEKTQSFIFLINNLEIANSYTERVVTKLSDPPSASQVSAEEYPPTPLNILFPFSTDADDIKTALKTLNSVLTHKSSQLLNDGVSVLYAQQVQPRLRPILLDAFRDISYTFTEPPPSPPSSPTLSPQSAGARFSSAFVPLLQPIQSILCPGPFSTLMNLISASLARIVEKKLKSILNGQNGQKVSILGAIQLERDISGIVSAVAGLGGWKVRAEFVRVVQIGMVLGMSGEYGEEEEDDGIEWVLTEEERRAIREAVSNS